MDYFPLTPHHCNGDWVDSCPSHTPTPPISMYMQYASESQTPVLGPDMASQRNHDRQFNADGQCSRDLLYAMHGPPTTWSAGTEPNEPANLEQVPALGLYYDYQPAYSPNTPPYYARLPALYVNTEPTNSPLFLSPTISTPVTPLHTDEAFARMQRQSSGYVPSISAALDAPISRRQAAVVGSSLGAHQSDISRPPHPTSLKELRKAPLTKAEPDSPTLSPSPEPSVKEEESASPKSKSSSYMYTQFRFRKGRSAESPECTERSESSSAEPSTPPLQINKGAIQLAKRGLSRARRTQHLACFFCRRRKIACVAPDTDDPDRTCNQCERRGLSCSFPAESHRGLRYKARDTGRRSATASEDKHSLAG